MYYLRIAAFQILYMPLHKRKELFAQPSKLRLVDLHLRITTLIRCLQSGSATITFGWLCRYEVMVDF